MKKAMAMFCEKHKSYFVVGPVYETVAVPTQSDLGSPYHVGLLLHDMTEIFTSPILQNMKHYGI